jgi:hypothetical protein
MKAINGCRKAEATKIMPVKKGQQQQNDISRSKDRIQASLLDTFAVEELSACKTSGASKSPETALQKRSKIP